MTSISFLLASGCAEGILSHGVHVVIANRLRSTRRRLFRGCSTFGGFARSWLTSQRERGLPFWAV